LHRDSDEGDAPKSVDSIVREMSTPAAVSTVASALRLASDSLDYLRREAEENPELPVLEFVDHVRLGLQQDRDGPGGICLSTVHQAKGLEWDYVYVIGATKNVWPGRSAGDDRLEEERRLFYVAMSRAKRELQISFLLDPGPSPFILELPETAIRERLQKPDEPERPSLQLAPREAVFRSVRELALGKMPASAPPGQLQLTAAAPPRPRQVRGFGRPRLTLVPANRDAE
jgi:DNA helicase-2/ATP-dependent DNA helicase PcrA